jgi:hypothetical protein
MLRLLLRDLRKTGADMKIKNKAGQSGMDLACRIPPEKLVSMLLDGWQALDRAEQRIAAAAAKTSDKAEVKDAKTQSMPSSASAASASAPSSVSAGDDWHTGTKRKVEELPPSPSASAAASSSSSSASAAPSSAADQPHPRSPKRHKPN